MTDPAGGNPGDLAAGPAGPLRRLVILRHAAADYHFDGPDRNRPLTQEGEHTALNRGRQLGRAVASIDRLLVSPAVTPPWLAAWN